MLIDAGLAVLRDDTLLSRLRGQFERRSREHHPKTYRQ
jgi:hypothetical protein